MSFWDYCHPGVYLAPAFSKAFLSSFALLCPVGTPFDYGEWGDWMAAYSGVAE